MVGVVVQSLSHVQIFCNSMACPLSMGFSRQEHWSGLPFPSPGDLLNPGIKPASPASQADSLPLCHEGSRTCYIHPKSLQSSLTYLQPYGLQPPRLLCPWNFLGKNTGVGCHFLLQGIFLSQGWNPCLLHWQVDSFTPEPPGKSIASILHYKIKSFFKKCARDFSGGPVVKTPLLMQGAWV